MFHQKKYRNFQFNLRNTHLNALITNFQVSKFLHNDLERLIFVLEDL